MKTYGDYLAEIFPGIKVQKISIDAGFSCPNRDGKIGIGGCSYCRNDSFSPDYCNPGHSIAAQIEKGKSFFSRKYPAMKYLAYFQRYTGTYGHSVFELEKFYREAMEQSDVVGLVIATRPDCVSPSTLDLLEQLNREKPVFMEIGAETSFDDTLRIINRNHTWADVENSVKLLSQRGLRCGIHLIAGLPGESNEMVITTVKRAIAFPIETLKLHQLQILYDTPLFHQWKNGEVDVKNYSLEEYVDLCAEIVKIVPPNIIIERFLSQSPPQLVAHPKWGLKNYQFMSLLDKKFNKLS